MCCTGSVGNLWQLHPSILNRNRKGLVPGALLTVTAVRLGILSPGGSRLGDPVSIILLLATVGRCLRLVGERHNGGGGIGGGGVVLGVGEAVQVLAGGIDGAVDGTFGGATYAVLLCLIQVVGDTSFYTWMEVTFSRFLAC